MSVPRRLLVLYGSQEGCAESVAQRIAGDAARKYGWDVELLTCNSFKKTTAGTILQEKMCVVVSSTTGNGDPPDNCDRFWRYLKRRSHAKDLFSDLHYSVLGLGDTNYDKFCHIAKGIDRKMYELGGNRFFDLGCADDAVGLNVVIEPWITGFFQGLEKTYKTLTADEKRKKEEISTATTSSTTATTATTPDTTTSTDSKSIHLDGHANFDTISIPAIARVPPTTSDFKNIHTDDCEMFNNSISSSTISLTTTPTDDNGPQTHVLPLPVTTSSTTENTSNRLVILYGRKNNFDKEVAESLGLIAKNKYGWNSTTFPCSKYRRTGTPGGFMSETVVLLIMPILNDTENNLDDGCERFLRFINRSSHAPSVLDKMKFAVISIGDDSSSGEDYGIDVDVRLHELGASRYATKATMRTVVGNKESKKRWCEDYWSQFDTGKKNDKELVIDTNGTVNPCAAAQETSESKESTESPKQQQLPPPLPDRLRNIHTDFGVFGNNYDETIRRAHVAPLPRVLAAGFNCVFPPKGGSSPTRSGSYSEVSSGQDSQHSSRESQFGQRNNTQYSLRHPFHAEIVNAKYLTTGGQSSNRRVIHLDLNLLPDKSSKKYNPFKAKRMIQYIPGDAIGIVVPNDDSIVEWLLYRLQLTKNSDDEFIFETEGKDTPTPTRDIAMGGLPKRRSMQATSIPLKYRTPRLTLTHVLDLNTPPRRGLLRALADFCIPGSNFTKEQCEIEKSKLLILSSRDGRDEYDKIITKLNSGLPEILKMFPTCLPPLSVLVGGLKMLMPRYYSVSSSPLNDPTKLSITFTVVEYNTKPPSVLKDGKSIDNGNSRSSSNGSNGSSSNSSSSSKTNMDNNSSSKINSLHQRPIQRQGLCTSWLEKVSMPMILENELLKNINNQRSIRSRGSSKSSANSASNSAPNSESEIEINEMNLDTKKKSSATNVKIPIYIRETKEFALPANHKYPIIMVGPGTGVAPFIGFLEHRQKQALQQSDHKDDVCSGYWRMGFELEDLEDDEEYSGQKVNSVYGECVLFFGNRNRSKDFLYEKKLNEFLKDGTLNQLHVAFSRDGPKKIYVQDKMKEQSSCIYRLLMKENGYLYVCGDGAKMAKDVEKALIDIFMKEGNMKTKEIAIEALELLKKKSRYVKDVWS